MRQYIAQFDSSITQYITNWSHSLHSFFLVVTALGSPLVTLTIGGLIVLYGYIHTNFRLAFCGGVVWGTLGIGTLLKILIARERPLTEYAANLVFDTHSFPSGHTSGSTIAYGLLAYVLWQLLPQPYNIIIVSILILFIFLIGISRIYLGAHFPSDVIAGWVLGIIALCGIIFIVRPMI